MGASAPLGGGSPAAQGLGDEGQHERVVHTTPTSAEGAEAGRRQGRHATVTIYALIDPRDGSARYVGQTRSELEVSLAAHVSGRAWGDTPKDTWIRDLVSAGFRPSIQSLAVSDADSADAMEREQIETLVSQGCKLVNVRHNEKDPLVFSGDLAEGSSVQVRLPRWMQLELKTLSQGRRIKRSLNAEIVAALDSYLESQRPKDAQ